MFISIIMFYFTNVSAYAQEPDSSTEETFSEELLEEPYEEEAEQYERAKVLEVENTDGAGLDEGFYTEILSVRIAFLSGERKGEESDAIHYLTGNPGHDFSVTPGDRVLVNIQEIDGETEVHIIEYVRDTYIYIVGGIFIALLILLGGMKGIKTIITLALTLFLLLYVLIPGLLAGYSPILLTIGISIIITVVTILIVGGRNIKSYAAIIGVLGGVLIAGIIAYVSGSQMNLTGLSSQEAGMLMFIPQEVDFNFSGLLFAGIVMGALGAVMDVGMSIASAMEEIHLANPTISTKNLISAGMNVGKDIMGTMANTLILAYIASMIPLLLLFTAYQEPFISIINMDVIATEVIRALSGSIGLILSIPLTAISAGLLRDKIKPQKVSLSSKETSE
ncbi:YibE/F family protein [Alkalibacterium sp. 20]|nr:YibE/F family protein [Alkalibacterium sp. 20]